MLALKIIGIIVLVFVLIGLIPVGFDISFIEDRLKISLKAAGFMLQVFPRKKKKPEADKEEKPEEEKPNKEKKAKPKKKKKEKEINLYFRKEEIFGLLKKIFSKIGRFNRSFRSDRFLFHYIAGGSDPYNVAKKFAYINAILSTALPVTDRRFKCKDLDVCTSIDFTRKRSYIDFALSIVLPIGALPVLVFGILNSAIAAFVKNKVRLLYEKMFDKELYLEDTTEKNYLNIVLTKVKEAKARKAQEAAEDKIIKETMDSFDSERKETGKILETERVN